MNLTDILWQNVFSKKGHSTICQAPFSSRALPHPHQEVESMCPCILLLILGRTSWLPQQIEYGWSEIMWPLRLCHKNVLHFHLVLLGWSLFGNSAITLSGGLSSIWRDPPGWEPRRCPWLQPSYQLTVRTNPPAMQGSHLEMDFPASHQTTLVDAAWSSDELSPMSPPQTEDCEQNNWVVF